MAFDDLTETVESLAKTLENAGANWLLHDLQRAATTGMARLGVAPHVADRQQPLDPPLRQYRGEELGGDLASNSRSRFFEKLEWSPTGSSTPIPTNQRNSRSYSIRSISWRSERTE
jgi:hypothetical protein